MCGATPDDGPRTGRVQACRECPKFFERAVHVILDGLLADLQLVTNFTVSESFNDERNDLPFAQAERLGLRGVRNRSRNFDVEG